MKHDLVPVSEPHMEVVERIKSDPDRVCLLVVDPEARRYFEEHHLTVDTHMKHLKHIVCPSSRSGHRLQIISVPRPENNDTPNIPKRRDHPQSSTTYPDAHTLQRQPPTSVDPKEVHRSLEETGVQRTGNNGFLKQRRSEDVDTKNCQRSLGRARSTEVVVVGVPPNAAVLKSASIRAEERIHKLTGEKYSEPLEELEGVSAPDDAVERCIRKNENFQEKDPEEHFGGERLASNEPVHLLGSELDLNQGKNRKKTEKTQSRISEVGTFEQLYTPSEKASVSSSSSEKLGHSLRDKNESEKLRAKSFEYSISASKHSSHKGALLTGDKKDDKDSSKLSEKINSVKRGECSRQNSTDRSSGRGSLLNGRAPPPINDHLKIDLDVDLERLKLKLVQNRRKQHTPMKPYIQRKRDFDAL